MVIPVVAPAWIGVTLFTTGGLFGQATADQPAFEVVSIKPSGAQSKTLGIYTFPGGRVTGENRSLSNLIEKAFDLERFQISGGEKWVREDRYDFDARPPKSAKSSGARPADFGLPPNDEQRQMLKAMLVDRFQLKYHFETKEGPVYFLTKGKKEVKFADAKNKDVRQWVGSPKGAGLGSSPGIAGANASMAVMAVRLAEVLERPVIDKTGIEGSFDFRYEYVSDDPNQDRIAMIIASVQGLGLKLEAGKAPIQYLVIDSAAKPSEN